MFLGVINTHHHYRCHSCHRRQTYRSVAFNPHELVFILSTSGLTCMKSIFKMCTWQVLMKHLGLYLFHAF